MPRTAAKPDDLAAINARREALLAQLAEVDEQAKAATEAARDAGRSVLMAALERVKIPALDKADARIIATALATQGGKSVAEHLSTLPKQ